MKNLSIQNRYTLPYRNSSRGENSMVKKAVQGLVVIGVSYIGLKIVLGIFGLVLSAIGFILPLGALSAAAYGGWQWLKNR